MSHTPFVQTPPSVARPYETDRALRLHLERLLPSEARGPVDEELRSVGARVTTELEGLARESERDPPKVAHYDAWGQRVDRLEVSPAWLRLVKIAAEIGTVAVAYERPWGEHSRIHQMALLHLFSASSATASCPMAMTDGAARTMETVAASEPFAAEAFAHLTSRDPDAAWTAGQWMTEKEGGSDVGRSSTQARFDGERWRLWGTKYFTSATTAECALTLARPEGAGGGSRHLAMFYVEPWTAPGRLNRIRVRKLKDKLGTRALPTAELALEGAVAHPIGDPSAGGGVRNISHVLNLTRYWNSTSAVSAMRRAVHLATDYAHKRMAFGAPIIEHPAHAWTLAELQIEYEAALAMVVRLAHLIGRVECGTATEGEAGTLRLLTPLAKLFTAKQAVRVCSEALEAFGGAGYMEDTGLARMLRDAQVLPIWEGTTNILSLDTLRAIAREDALGPFLDDIATRVEGLEDPRLRPVVEATRGALDELRAWFTEAMQAGPVLTQMGARGFAFALSRTMIASLLGEVAQWALATRGERRPLTTALRWSEAGLTRELGRLDAERLDAARALLDGMSAGAGE